jgi:hypothetical protein
MRIIITLCCISTILGYSQINYELKIDPGDCNVGNSTNYFYVGDSTEIILKNGHIADSIKFYINNQVVERYTQNTFKVISYNIGEIVVQSTIYYDNNITNIKEIFYCIPKPQLRVSLEKNNNEKTSFIVTFSASNDDRDISSSYAVCFCEYKICYKKKTIFEGIANSEIDIQEISKFSKKSIKSNSTLIITGIRILDKIHNRSFWLECNVELLLV